MKTRIYGCGTEAGYSHHKRHDEEPCTDCITAARKVWRERAQERKTRATRFLKELGVDTMGRRTNPWKHARVSLPPPVGDAWRDDALCTTSNIDFHSDAHDQIVQAIALCLKCPVRRECLTEQQLIQAPGVWGGIRWIPKAGNKMKPDTRYL